MALFLVALVSMMLVSQRYDAYQRTVNAMQQGDIDRASEAIQAVYPGLGTTNQQASFCGSTTCYNYTLVVSNLGIGAQIARIYINSTAAPCSSASLCVLNPAGASSTNPNRFLASDSYVNPGEFFHKTQLWIPGQLPTNCLVGGNSLKYGCNTITIVTSRGRVFSFLFPFPPSGETIGGGEGGGTGLYIGPLVITFDQTLLEYTTHTQLNPQVPIAGPPGPTGYWKIPTGTLVLYVKIQTDVGVPSDVYLTAQSVFEIAQFNSPGSVNFFFVIAPISKGYCQTAFSTAVNCNLKDSLNNDVYPNSGNTGDPNSISQYRACPVSPQNYKDANCGAFGKRYVIPKPTQTGKRGEPVIVAFAATTASGNNAQSIQGSWNGNSVTSFLGLSYVYNEGVTGSEYVYGVTLPFIAMCVVDSPTTQSCNI